MEHMCRTGASRPSCHDIPLPQRRSAVSKCVSYFLFYRVHASLRHITCCSSVPWYSQYLYLDFLMFLVCFL